MLDLVKGLVESKHMLGGGVRCLVGCGLKQFEFDLKRCVADQTRNLRFRGDLLRHQIEHKDMQRSDVLRDRAGLCHNKDVFIKQSLSRGEKIGNFNRHLCLLEN